MEAVNELNEAVKKVTESANKINEEINEMIFDKAPLIIHQTFCAELVKKVKKNEGKKMDECQDVLDVMTAIRILEVIYPELSKI